MDDALDTTLTVNGTQVTRRIPARLNLVDRKGLKALA